MKAVFQANDGTVFDTETECLEYEVPLNIKNEIALHVTTYLGATYCEDLRCDVIEPSDVVGYILKSYEYLYTQTKKLMDEDYKYAESH